MYSCSDGSYQKSVALVALFPGPRPASRPALPYCKRWEAGQGPGNKAIAFGCCFWPYSQALVNKDLKEKGEPIIWSNIADGENLFTCG